MATSILQPLHDAIASGDHVAIAAAIPEPPAFLPALFATPPAEREVLLAGVFPVLATDEDRWEIIEAAAQDSIAHPERGAFLGVIPFITRSLLQEACGLAGEIRDDAVDLQIYLRIMDLTDIGPYEPEE